MKIRWYGRSFASGTIAHVGLDTAGAANILGASWSIDNSPLSAPLPITFERTRVTPVPTGFDINMELNFAQSYFDDPGNPSVVAWTGIRTWANIPADVLSLADLTTDLDFALLGAYETDPRVGSSAGPLIDPLDVFPFDDSSIFDVWVADTTLANPNYESLLYAEVIVRTELLGRFWNLNQQSPTPGTLALLGVCGFFAVRRR